MNRYEKKKKVNSQKWIENENVSNHERIFHQFRLQNSSDKGKIRDIFEITKRQNRSFGDISMARRGGEKKKTLSRIQTNKRKTICTLIINLEYQYEYPINYANTGFPSIFNYFPVADK